MACGNIQGSTTNKNYYHNNVAGIQILPHWGTNRECSVNQAKTVYNLFVCFLQSLFVALNL